MAVQISATNLNLNEKATLAAAQVDITALYTAVKALTAKLDALAGVFGGTNYAATCNPAAPTFNA